MQRHSDKNSSILREDVSRWCWPNDCSRSGALQCTARYEDRILRTPPGNSSGIAKSRLRDRRDSFILSCLQRQHYNAATSACRSASTFPGLLSASTFPGLLSNVCSCALCAGSAACSSDATYTAASGRISTRIKATFNGETNYRSATILGILLQRNLATVTSVAPKRAFGRFSWT